MNRLYFGIVTTAPDAYGFGTVLFAGAARRVYFQPERFTTPWPIPVADDRVAVYHDQASQGREWQAVWCIGRGAPTYEWAG